MSSSGAKTTLKLSASTASLTNDKVEIIDNIVKQWATTFSEVVWDVKFEKTGKVDVSIELANDEKNSGSEIEVDINGQKASGTTTFSGGWDKFTSMPLGSLDITKTGLNTVKIRALNIKGHFAGDLNCVKLFGPPAGTAEEYEIPSGIDTVKLLFEDGGGADYFYNKIKVMSSFPGTFFQVCGFKYGVFGIQEADFSGKKLVVFDLWNPEPAETDKKKKTASSADAESDKKKKTADADTGKKKKTAPLADADTGKKKKTTAAPAADTETSEKKKTTSSADVISIVSQSENVEVNKPSDGSGKWKCVFPYDWKFSEVYQFLLKVVVDDDTKSTLCSAYFYIDNRRSHWKHLVTFKIQEPKSLMLGLNCYIEDFFGKHGRFPREAAFGPAWRHALDGDWSVLTTATFAQDGKLKNTSAGVTDDGQLFLKAGRRTFQDVAVGSKITSMTNFRLPEVLDDIDSQLKF